MSQDSHRRKKVQICSTSPGYPVYCPRCNSTNVLIFYDPRFTPRLQTKWDDLIDEKRILLENRWEKIKGENRWGKSEKGSEKPNWNCKDCYDGGIIVEHSIDKKIADEFKKYEKTFTEKSEPRYWNELAQKVTLKEIHDNADTGESSVVLIAVTRQQYNFDRFPEYRKYLKDVVKTDTIYYGLWPDTENKKVEYDILYTINSTDKDEIQKHLNLHDQMNDGVAQKMALIIDKDGKWETQDNEEF